MQRRGVLWALGAALFAGCSALPGPGPERITPEATDDDGTATLGELRYLLAENDVEEFERLDVRSMTSDGEVVRLTYASDAANPGDFVDEVGTVAAVYAIYIGNDGTVERLDVTVEPNYDDQARSFSVEAEWVRRYNDDALSGNELVNRVLGTATYPEQGNESS